MLSIKTLGFIALFAASTIYSVKINAADLHLTLAEPSWTFLVRNNAVDPRALSPAENSFVRELQPLLKAKKYQAVNEQLQQFSDNDESAAMLLLRGQIALALEQLTKAENVLEKAIQKEPELALAHNTLALIHLRNNLYEKARPHLQASIELGEQNAQVIGQLAYVNMQLGYSAAAVAGFRRALFLDATNKEWQQGLLFSLVHSKAFPQAQAMLEQMLVQTPNDKALWMLRSQIALQSGDNFQAISSLESAIALGESTPSNLMTAVQLHLSTGSPKRAVELLTHPTVFNKNIKLEHQQQLAQIAKWLAVEQQWDNLQLLLDRRNTQTTTKQLDAILAVSEARLAQHEGQTSKAEKILKRALQIAPTQGDALIELATLLKEQQRYTLATQYYLRAEALPTHREAALLGRAKVAIDLAEYTKALHLVGQVAQENPNRTDLVSTIATLKNLVRNTL